jgi:glycosidase
MKQIKTLLVLLLSMFVAGCSSSTQDSTSANSQTVSTAEWSKNATIYELNIRQFSEEGTFNAIVDRLDELKAMNVEIIWLMPIHPIGEKNRKGELGSYYAVKDYLDVNPEFGTKADFRNLVEEIHNRDMKVIIDWVANHTAWDNPLTEEHPEWYTKDEEGNFVPPVEDWSDVIDLNYDNSELRSYMTDALKFWVEEFDIDGYRCDVASMVPTDYWNSARKELDEIKPVFMLAEAEEPELNEKAFDMYYGWTFHHILNEVAQGEQNADSLHAEVTRLEKAFPDGSYPMNFISNHDENTWNGTVWERMGAASYPLSVLTATLPGMPLLYNGQEAGMDKRLDFFDKDPIEWSEHDMREHYSKLFELKQNNPALQHGKNGGAYERISTSVDEDVYAFIRTNGIKQVFVIVNLSDQKQRFTIESTKVNGEFESLFDGDYITFDRFIEVEIDSWGYKVYHK